MLCRSYVLKQIANETLERTTGGQVSGLDPEDAKQTAPFTRSHHFYRKQ